MLFKREIMNVNCVVKCEPKSDVFTDSRGQLSDDYFFFFAN